MLTAETIGNLGQDAEVKEINGNKYVSFSVAPLTKKDEKTTWVGVLMSGDGGNLLPYLKKGTRVFVSGNLSVKAYADKNGVAQPSVTIYSRNIVLCGSKNEAQQVANQKDDMPF